MFSAWTEDNEAKTVGKIRNADFTTAMLLDVTAERQDERGSARMDGKTRRGEYSGGFPK